MSAAFRQLFAADIEQVIMIGSDIPGLDYMLLESASKSLGIYDAAIAPAVDGGYCLIALNGKSYRSRIFQDIEWSTDSVLHSTLERFGECGLRVKLLESRQDIDTVDDLNAYCRNPSEMAQATNEWLSASGYLSEHHHPSQKNSSTPTSESTQTSSVSGSTIRSGGAGNTIGGGRPMPMLMSTAALAGA